MNDSLTPEKQAWNKWNASPQTDDMKTDEDIFIIGYHTGFRSNPVNKDLYEALEIVKTHFPKGLPTRNKIEAALAAAAEQLKG